VARGEHMHEKLPEISDKAAVPSHSPTSLFSFFFSPQIKDLTVFTGLNIFVCK
jgi:hypothetical protein